MTPSNDTQPTFSVIIPCFNAEATIAQTLDSVLSQDVSLEVLIQDGASTDDTLSRIPADQRISLESAQDRGQADAFNRALARSTGEWIGWLNADDVYAPQALAHVFAQTLQHPTADVLFGDFATVDGNNRPIRRYILSRQSWYGVARGDYRVFSGATFWNRRVFERYGPLDASLHYCMDLEFALRISEHVHAVHTPEVLAYFRIHNESKTGAKPLSFLREGNQVRYRYMPRTLSTHIWIAQQSCKTLLYLVTRPLWLSRAWSDRRTTKRMT